MKAEDIKRLFVFFGRVSQVKEAHGGGMGYGLTISKMILEQLNGEIRVESEFGAGSTFTFDIEVDLSQYSKREDCKHDGLQYCDSELCRADSSNRPSALLPKRIRSRRTLLSARK